MSVADFDVHGLRPVPAQWGDPAKLLALCIWREARGEIYQAKLGVGCSIRNRTLKPRWWGHDYISVILMPLQYSSFNPSDPNSRKFPASGDQVWNDCLTAAAEVMQEGSKDAALGADSYYDDSIAPPRWARPPAVLTVKIGRLNFYRTV